MKIKAGDAFGNLTAIKLISKQRGGTRWQFRCVCGAKCVKYLGNIRRGIGLSCGCDGILGMPPRQQWEVTANSREYRSWKGMFERCYNVQHPKYHLYGGKGIKVCSRWYKFENFLIDMGKRPSDTSIDRYPNKNGDYAPDNCRWATISQQNHNRQTPANFTGYPGVRLSRTGCRFRAVIRIAGITISLGTFATAEEAAAVYAREKLARAAG